MKDFRRRIPAIIVMLLVIWGGANYFLLNGKEGGASRPYRVEAERLVRELTATGTWRPENYIYITGIEKLTAKNAVSFYKGNSDYLVRTIGDEVYRIDYSYTREGGREILLFNLCMGVVFIVVLFVIVGIWSEILLPFERLRDLPYTLAKGNLSVPLKDSKNNYFGSFLWGMDVLREELEVARRRELQLHKEKKTLVLSLSHDIRTPLGVIELYAKALRRGLYRDEEKNKEIAENIHVKCMEINGYVEQIIHASQEDFLRLEVRNGDFYLMKLMEETERFYSDKLARLQTELVVESNHNYLLKGDLDRAVEVLQNLMENAIKYGDGRRIVLREGEEEDCVLVQVENGGCTLSESELIHIFDSFWRGSNVGANPGSGLGLYICKELMHKMDGELYAECRGGDMTVTAVFRRA